MKKVLLLFPPEWVPTAPYLALPSLTSVLRQNGIDVVQKDINVEMYDHIFSREFLLFVKGRIDQRLRDLREKQRMGSITREERDIKEQINAKKNRQFIGELYYFYCGYCNLMIK